MPKTAPHSHPKVCYTSLKIVLQKARQRARREQRNTIIWELKNAPGNYFITNGNATENQVMHGKKIGWAGVSVASLLGKSYCYEKHQWIRETSGEYSFSARETWRESA